MTCELTECYSAGHVLCVQGRRGTHDVQSVRCAVNRPSFTSFPAACSCHVADCNRRLTMIAERRGVSRRHAMSLSIAVIVVASCLRPQLAGQSINNHTLRYVTLTQNRRYMHT